VHDGARAAFAAIEAQPGAVRVLAHALETDRLATAYLFVGPSGVGKQATALALACAAVCTEAPRRGCGHCDAEKRAREGIHPDVRVFPPRDEGDRNLQVAYVRDEILPLVRFAPFEAPVALFVFPEADVSFPVQHAEGANALLKTLEEPRAGVHFLLLSERPDRLLPTIRSRAQRVRFGSLPRAALLRILDAHGVPAETRDAAVALAQGRADRALQLARDGLAERVIDGARRVDDAVAARSAGVLLDACDALARDDARDLVLDAIELFYRDVAASGLGLDAGALCFSGWADAARARASTLRPSTAAARVAAVGATRTALEERNANPEIALDGLAFSFGAA
jgi:DNA polymerase-3 subunit delta'